MRQCPVIVSAACIIIATAHASQAAGSVAATATVSRHHTTNALDSPRAIADWYTVLRGALEAGFDHELGSTRIAANAELRRFDRIHIENDAAFGISGETTARISERIELRGTLSLNVIDEGDDLDLGEIIIGMRTRKTRIAASAQAGLQLSSDTILILEGAVSREQSGDTRFEDDLLVPIRLEPIRDRLRLGGTLTRTTGKFSYGVRGATGILHSEPIGFLPRIRVLDYHVALQGGMTFANGASIVAAAGLHGLQVLDADFSELRPSYEAVAQTPLPAGFSLRGALKAAYDPASNDDPIAIWVRRLEAEVGYQPAPAVRLGAGFYLETRANIGLESIERARGLYAEATWQPQERITLSLRVDGSRKQLDDSGVERKAVDIRMAVNASL